MTEAAAEAKETVKNVAHTTHAAAEDFLDHAEHSAHTTIKNTREAAHNALEKAQEGLQAIEKELSPSIDELATRAQALCSHGIQVCAQRSDQIRQQVQLATEKTTRYVIEQPGKSILMAAATGAAIATALILSRRR